MHRLNSSLTGRGSKRFVTPTEFPSFIQGNIKTELEKVYQEIVSKYSGNNNLEEFGFGEDVAIGSSFLINAAIYPVLRKRKLRPVFSRDDQDGEVSRLILGKYYTDFNDLIVHSPNPVCRKNRNVLRKLIETTEDKEGTVKFPFKVEGVALDVFPEDFEEGYGVRFVPTEDWRYVSDKRLNFKSGTKFKNIDDLGIPDFAKDGLRTWRSTREGLSGLFTGGGLGLFSYGGFSGSSSEGRVVLTETENVSLKNYMSE